jgi:hypothetical protein
MKAQLRSRLERLEARTVAIAPPKFRYGAIKPLPTDYTGERHVVIVTREPTRSPNVERCEFEERPGPPPPGSDSGGVNVYMSEVEMKF